MLKFLLTTYNNHRLTIAFIIGGSITASLLELWLPMGIRYILDTLLPAGNSESILKLAAILLLLYIISYLINWQVFFRGRFMGAQIEYYLRSKLFRHVLHLDFAYFDNANSGKLISRLISDIAEIGELMFSIPHLLLVCTITMLGTISMLFYINIPLASVVAVLLVIKAYEAVQLNRNMKASFLAARQETAKITACAAESLAAIRLVKAFNNEPLEEKKINLAGTDLLNVQKDTFRVVGRLNSSLPFFSNITNLIIIVLGGILTQSGYMKLSDLITFLLYMMIFMKPVFQLTVLTETYQRGMAGFTRYLDLIHNPIFKESPAAIKFPEKPAGKIQFKQVSFAYENNRPLFKDFNLTINPGEVVAIVGPTGSGKSTLCQLLLRLYDINSGSISIDDIDIKQLKLTDLRKNIGIVQQDIFLFSDTIRGNIAYGDPKADFDAIKNAAKCASAANFIEQLPQKYDTNIGERGVKLSGGQKQRLAIARIFLKNPPILILDEATSALDNETEQQIQIAMDALAGGRTTLIVAHRLATIKNADRIIVIDAGQIRESGTHTELMKNRALYYNLYMTQFQTK